MPDDQVPVLDHPLNTGVLAYLGRAGEPVTVSRPESHSDPYRGAGSHPDVVSRVWDELGAPLSSTRRCLVGGTPALVLRANGLVLAVALGTSYAVRLAPSAFREALRAGAETEHVFASVQVVLDLQSAFGDGWVFGTWHKNEFTWCTTSWEAWPA